MICAICLYLVSDPQPAITVLNGNATCEDHLTYASLGDRAISTAMRENPR